MASPTRQQQLLPSLPPCCHVEARSSFLPVPKAACPAPLLHMEASKHRSWVVWRADQPFGYGTASLQGRTVVFRSNRAVGGASQCRSISAASSPPPLATPSQPRVLPLSVGDNTHRHTYSLLGSCGMSNLLLWNGFSSSSFYSTPAPLQLVS